MDKNIIDNKQKQKKVFFERLLTITGWIFMLYNAIQIIATIILWIFSIRNTYYTFEDNVEVIYTFFILIILALAIFIIIITWSTYNLKKYGKLRRRKFAKNVSDEDIITYFNITEEKLKSMKKDRIIYINKNIDKKL
ncbi:poly-beta-1,6-N-acetyl-D-glucosamine biosynthesis protein PgaD [Defluviitalea phaphyphila]|uniref:poly-beta-1,6-N-acetyl-D-glucosamine biosynthesis protein PgaD n=1 Tax=Defluviitalea phaphyphila TaxID=1473580 RepID=UPI000730DFA2|nr:poly-beta-1,6-N-acetyl-D-glucosamine biosynthesis protein PgaD [Defluviitalea phaphyphila]